VLLLAAMPGLVPPSAILPVHAVAQLGSNSSRAAFGWRHIDWQMLPPLLAGAAVGAAMGGAIYQGIDLRWLPGVIGVFILILTWWPPPQVGGGGRWSLFLLGGYQTGLGMIAGATGPLGAAVLMRRNRDRDWLVINTAVYMTVNHLVRVAAFAVLGFAFSEWLALLVALLLAVTAGSWLGSRLRARLPQRNFQRWFRWLVTALALRMIVHSVIAVI
jgi:uncharacterized membrane protein YfcA